MSGRTDRIIISAIAGLGDRLVGGEEDGQTYSLDRTNGATVAGPADPVLSQGDLTKLRNLAEQLRNGDGRAAGYRMGL
ncbi:hypothetical protein N8D56_20205 [Devosia sp. A8/3-2]|nr:hypothetical protein N8D56_20205 [Devosia sp. A8/3-2]